MRKADTRLNSLRDLLHHAGLPPMTGTVAEDESLVIKPPLRRRTTMLVGEKKISRFLVLNDYTQFQASLGYVVRTTMMAKIQQATNLTWIPPLQKGQSMKMTLLNRLAEKKSNRRLVHKTFRVLDKWNGKKRRADVKVVLNGAGGRPHLYFARYNLHRKQLQNLLHHSYELGSELTLQNFTHNRCHAFFKDSVGNFFMAVQWYTEFGPDPVHEISLLAQLKLAPDNLLNSYDILSVTAVVNGAFLIQNGEFYWAIQSPREQKRYITMNTTRA